MSKSLDQLEKRMMDFCFGNHCIYHNPENPLICRLVTDARSQQPTDYCPLIKFLDWMKRRAKTKGRNINP